VSDRRGRIVEAALVVIARGGPAAATHRAVAAEAGVALASTTYHFASKDEIVAAAFELAIERSIAAVERSTAPPRAAAPGELCERLLALVDALCADDQAPLAAQYELLLEAGRRPELRVLAERWSRAYLDGLEALVDSAGIAGPRLAAEVLSDLIDGALLARLSEPQGGDAGSLERRIERVVAGLAATHGG
jgi:TetR/AcrR family transcriptional regulator, regulator of biofilm formation and stress response